MPTVLLVDDQPDNLIQLTAMLRHRRCRVITATGGEEALVLIARRRPDVVLLDLMMPDLDGFEVCRRIKAGASTRLTPVVLITRFRETKVRVQGLSSGADDFLIKPLDADEVNARVQSFFELRDVYDRMDRWDSVMAALARAVEAKDGSTEAHVRRVARRAYALGRRAGLDHAELEALHLGGLIHDIGKIGVPDSILLKPGPLAPSEVEAMRKHCAIGVQIARPLRFARRVIPIIRHHHENFDGSGYPDGLRGEEIPLPARIVAVCDAYDAMISKRAYRRAKTPLEAIAVLSAGAGTQWDPRLVDMFVRDRFGERGRPVGSRRSLFEQVSVPRLGDDPFPGPRLVTKLRPQPADEKVDAIGPDLRVDAINRAEYLIA